MRGAEGGGPADRAGAEAGMGARHGEDDGRRPAALGGSRHAEALLAAALRGELADAEGERRAVAAFRTAREAEPARAVRTRRRDDWRPRAGRRTGRTLKTALSVLLASLTLGGVAYAAMGGGGSAADDGGRDRVRPPAPADGASVRPVATPRAATPAPATTPPGASPPPERPDTAGDTEAQCRAYERLDGRGGALDATAWQRLLTAAGGAEHLEAYCAGQSARETGTNRSNGEANGEGNGGAGGSGQENDGQGNGDQGSDGQGSGDRGKGVGGEVGGAAEPTPGRGQ
ncbi:hypothetical protein [Streptomyces sp. NPDC060275]|uniref:hypothetical protein n=1 Tax=Streptomyces sp. NPDC060275 TaxID=3347090 RepID=UPI00364AD003